LLTNSSDSPPQKSDRPIRWQYLIKWIKVLRKYSYPTSSIIIKYLKLGDEVSGSSMLIKSHRLKDSSTVMATKASSYLRRSFSSSQIASFTAILNSSFTQGKADFSSTSGKQSHKMRQKSTDNLPQCIRRIFFEIT